MDVQIVWSASSPGGGGVGVGWGGGSLAMKFTLLLQRFGRVDMQRFQTQSDLQTVASGSSDRILSLSDSPNEVFFSGCCHDDVQKKGGGCAKLIWGRGFLRQVV